MKKLFKVIWSCLYPILIYVLLAFVVVFAAEFLFQDAMGAMMITGIAAVAGFPVMLGFFMADNKKEGIRISDYFRETKISDYLMIAAAGAGTAIVLNMVIVSSGISRYDEGFTQMSEMIRAEGWIVLMPMAGVIIPIAEELIFRALIYKRLRSAYGVGFALFISALCFGIFHGNLIQGVYAFLLGLLLALIYEKWENICLCMLYHIAANTATLSLAFFSETIGKSALDSVFSKAYALAFLIFFVLCILFSILGIIHILRHKKAEILSEERKEEQEMFIEDILEAKSGLWEED